ncbi:PAS domain S-box protein [Desulfatitalea tepidiphila]|uniref:PAS domain S-box protein n=1 Tax=Desulfatitalea tepidiphila TaxID=1185843 RepID=UPI0006B5E85B|nr:PAS domain S-box protein [Desulfatitalea tepidiphila]
MAPFFRKLRNSLITKLLISVAGIMLVCLCIWGYLNYQYLQQKAMDDLAVNMDRLSNTIRLGTHYAMMLNSRDDIQQIINNVARQNDIENVRIYNKAGEIKYSNRSEEVDRQTNIKAEACDICHNVDPPQVSVPLTERVRLLRSDQGYRMMGIISPVYNEPGCATDACHVHPADKRVLGALDLVVSLKDVDREAAVYQRNLILLAVGLFVGIAVMIVFIILRFVTAPVKRLIQGARCIESGDYGAAVQINQNDEMKALAQAINQMGQSIGEKTQALNRQRNQYQNLFGTVPCIITVQDRNYRIIEYNREFAERFKPQPGAFCYQAYKGRDTKCVVCPVEMTFEDGLPHYSEESALDKDGTMRHWIVRTSPIKDAEGNIVAAMEMNLDISERKQLEEKLVQSEKKYHAIFNNIPNPVFVLDPETWIILDCNASVDAVYGFQRGEVVGTSFLELFWERPDPVTAAGLKTATVIERAKHRDKDGLARFVTIRISPSAYGGVKVLLVTISDITKRLEAEQQLIQASKMATLGEMATGVAHELNQPLSVIKTASSFFMRKLRNKAPIAEDVLLTMSEEIDSHVQRATKIINHMRQFGRKSGPELVPVQVNDILRQAFDIFSQQLKVRGIEVEWEITSDLPMVMGDPGRLEQVFINLLINARDTIEEQMAAEPGHHRSHRIRLSTTRTDDRVVVSVCDTGTGIPDGIAERIFEPFFTTKKVGQGTGLGLSISYGIIKECNGRIYTRPNPQGGACFLIEFPIPPET